MAQVIWSEAALAQLEAIVEVTALDRPEAATAVASRVFAATDNLSSFRGLGRPIPEFPHKDFRQVWIKPCWLYYRIDDERVYVLHVCRGEKMFRLSELLEDDK